ncbi:helix-turn-helix domain-containing protein [Ferrovibrio sp.]|uniref:helix-turn-helix domain-containing protein n=1 Tax=Ferrovibrio sp. TaxID=1917215 RepID=UPI0039C8AA2F
MFNRPAMQKPSNSASYIPLLHPKEAAAYLRLHPVTLAKMRMRGNGPSFLRIGRSIRYRQRDLEVWLERCRANNTACYGMPI